MNKSESKYFNTAKKMDKALITLLGEKVSHDVGQFGSGNHVNIVDSAGESVMQPTHNQSVCITILVGYVNDA